MNYNIYNNKQIAFAGYGGKGKTIPRWTDETTIPEKGNQQKSIEKELADEEKLYQLYLKKGRYQHEVIHESMPVLYPVKTYPFYSGNKMSGNVFPNVAVYNVNLSDPFNISAHESLGYMVEDVISPDILEDNSRTTVSRQKIRNYVRNIVLKYEDKSVPFTNSELDSLLSHVKILSTSDNDKYCSGYDLIKVTVGNPLRFNSSTNNVTLGKNNIKLYFRIHANYDYFNQYLVDGDNINIPYYRELTYYKKVHSLVFNCICPHFVVMHTNFTLLKQIHYKVDDNEKYNDYKNKIQQCIIEITNPLSQMDDSDIGLGIVFRTNSDLYYSFNGQLIVTKSVGKGSYIIKLFRSVLYQYNYDLIKSFNNDEDILNIKTQIIKLNSNNDIIDNIQDLKYVILLCRIKDSEINKHNIFLELKKKQIYGIDNLRYITNQIKDKINNGKYVLEDIQLHKSAYNQNNRYISKIKPETNNQPNNKNQVIVTERPTHTFSEWFTNTYFRVGLNKNSLRTAFHGIHSSNEWYSVIFQIVYTFMICKENNIDIKNMNLHNSIFIRILPEAWRKYWKYKVKGLTYYVPARVLVQFDLPCDKLEESNYMTVKLDGDNANEINKNFINIIRNLKETDIENDIPGDIYNFVTEIITQWNNKEDYINILNMFSMFFHPCVGTTVRNKDINIITDESYDDIKRGDIIENDNSWGIVIEKDNEELIIGVLDNSNKAKLRTHTVNFIQGKHNVLKEELDWKNENYEIPNGEKEQYIFKN